MIENLILSVLILITVLCLYIAIRNNKVYHFNINFGHLLFDELERILNSYKDDDEFNEDEENYYNIRDQVRFLLDKHSYNRYLFSFKPLKLEKWFTKEELEFITYLKQYRK